MPPTQEPERQSVGDRCARSAADDQTDVIDFLSSPAAYTASRGGVARYETHGALVFAAGDDVYKIKRAVRFAYMDFSTIDRRERILRRELEVNRALAPELYLEVIPVTREPDGRLALNGSGEPVEWALHMRRFRDEDLLSSIASRGPVERPLALMIADAVADAHAQAAVAAQVAGSLLVRRVIVQVADGLASEGRSFLPAEAARFREAALELLARHAPLLDSRAVAGFVRRCHGDLHLGNIVLWRGRPILFDALEFSEELATVDTLYDLAFLLMDLDRCGQRAAANLVLNRYLLRCDRLANVEGLAALPLLLAVRAAIRAMVGAERAAQEDGAKRDGDIARARRCFDLALGYLSPPAPRLVAIGGFSGTGKSTLAASLSPGLGAAPGALHIRADVERKALHGVEETMRLPAASYTVEAAARVYAAMIEKARCAIAAGHSAVVDAVFARPEERQAVEGAAAEARVRFDGLWLAAPPEVMIERVGRRTGDASDATPEVVAGQLERGAGHVAWSVVEAGGGPDATLAAAKAVLHSD